VDEQPEMRPRPRGRWSGWRVGTLAVALVSGGLFVVSAQSSEGTDLRPGRYDDLATLTESEADRAADLQGQVSDLTRQVRDLTDQVKDDDVQRYQDQVKALEDPAGLRARKGPGIEVTLSDAPSALIDASTGDKNLLVVHQQDIQAVVNAMWKGGAQAVTIQGQRVVSTTGIRCVGNSVQLQGVPYSQPYVISAVGDPTTLQAAIDTDPYLQVYRQDADNPDINVGWEDVVESRISAPGYDGLVGLQYARALPAADADG
jgi:uncharacterized protein YlxW (UPF0749 family)